MTTVAARNGEAGRLRKAAYVYFTCAVALWPLGIFLIEEYRQTPLAWLGFIIIVVAWSFTGVGVRKYGLSLLSRSDVNLPRSVILVLLPWAVLPDFLIMLKRGLRFPVEFYIYAEAHGWFVGIMILISVAAYSMFKGRLRNATDKLNAAVLIQPVVFIATVVIGDWFPADGAAYYGSGAPLAVYLGFALACNMRADADSREET